MRDPFIALTKEAIRQLIKLQRYYLVTQTYRSAFTPPELNEIKTKLIVTDYDDKGLAITHYKAVKGDKYAAVLDISTTKHIEKIVELLSPASQFYLCWAVIKNKELFEKQTGNVLKNELRKYVEKHTTWRINRDTTLYPKLELIYGEVYVNIRYGRERVKVKLEELRKVG